MVSTAESPILDDQNIQCCNARQEERCNFGAIPPPVLDGLASRCKMPVVAGKNSKPLPSYLVKLRRDRGWTQRDVASRTGLGANTISYHENGRTFPPMSIRRIYASVYGFSSVADFDAGWREGEQAGRRGVSKVSPTGRIPVINQAPAGQPRNYEECFTDSGIGFEYIDRGPGMPAVDLFAFVVVGDSMVPDFQPGDIVVCGWAELAEMNEGDPVFVRFGAERDHACTFKRIYRSKDGRIELRADNRRHSPLLAEPEEILRVGAVFEVRRRTKWSNRAMSRDDSTTQIGDVDE